MCVITGLPILRQYVVGYVTLRCGPQTQLTRKPKYLVTHRSNSDGVYIETIKIVMFDLKMRMKNTSNLADGLLHTVLCQRVCQNL